MRQPARVFISYAHEDEEFVRRLEAHLSGLKRAGLIEAWTDQRIDAGADWRRAIDQQLATADIVLLLVSADFLASEFCYGVEMREALERNRRGEARLLPILLKPVDFSSTELGALQMLPRGAKPVTTWRHQDEAWVDVMREVRHALESLPQRSGHPMRRDTAHRLLEEIPLPDMQAVRILFLPSHPSEVLTEYIGRKGEDLERRMRGSVRTGRLELMFGSLERGSDLLTVLVRHRPHIVHFVAHGDAPRAIADANGRPLHPAEVAHVFSMTRDVRCVVMQGCYTRPQADAISMFVDAVIGISHHAGEDVALAFSAAFYSSLSNGAPIRQAFQSVHDKVTLSRDHFQLATSGRADVSVTPQPTKAVHVVARLLLEMFSPTELRSLLAEHYDRSAQYVFGSSGSYAEQTVTVVQYLESSGLLDSAFFERLREVRPAREQEIVRAAELAGVRIARHAAPAKKKKTNRSKPPRAAEKSKPSPAPRKATRVHLFADEHDRAILERLTKHLTAYVRSGEIEVSTTKSIPVDIEPSSIFRHVADTDILVIFLSPWFLNSAAATHEATEMLLKLSRRDVFTVLPIVAAECDWRNSDFARFAVRPTEDSLSDARNLVDERWNEVVEAIRLMCRQRGTDVHISGPAPAANKFRVDEVFRTTGYPKVTFVAPTALSSIIVELRTPGRVLVVEGPSGVGKTVAVKRALEDLRADGQDWPTELLQMKLESDLAKARGLHERSIESIKGHLIIDDFHMLDVPDRIRVANYAKAFADTGSDAAKITLIGINQSGRSIMQSVPDLATRANVIALGREPDERILQLIGKGEQALNVRLLRRAEFALAANGSFVVAQMLCERALLERRLMQTQPSLEEVATDPATLFPDVIKTLWPQFHPKLQNFAMLDKDSPQRGGAIALLWHLGNSPDGSIAIADVRPQWPSLTQSMADALAAVASQHKAGVDPDWHALLDCDATTEQLTLDDPKLAFYLRFLDWVDFGHRCAVKLKRTPEGGLQFLDAAESSGAARRTVITGASAREVHLLHVSDLHFSASTTWDSDTVLDRLVGDIGQLVSSGRQPDLLIVSGDVANTGKAEEYDLARKWIVDSLLPAAKLTPASLVVTPGNHDADRGQIGRSTAALQKDLLLSRKQSEITQVLVNTRDRDVLLARHAAFVDLLNATQAGGRKWDLPWGAVSVGVRGLRVHVASLCSSWLSSGDADKGNLLLSLAQVNEAFQGAKNADLVLCAMHHPWSYMADFDDVSRHEVQRNSSILLRGHLHEAEHVMQLSPGRRGFIEIAAGATYESSQYSNAYHFITVQLDPRKVRVFPRYWDKQRRDWTADLNVFQGESGELTYGGR